MAAPSNAVASLRMVSMDQSEDLMYEVVTQLNLAIGAIRAICTKIDADAGTGMDTNYFATVVDAAGSHPAKQITLRDGL